MARKNLIRTSEFPYHVYARTNKREWFEECLEDVWDKYCDLLYILSFIYRCEIHAFVLMNNHFHLLISTPLENLDQAMLYFMRESSREINMLSNSNSRIYSGRNKWSLINNERYLGMIMKYVYQNPVKAGIVKKVEDNNFSTLRMKLGLTRLKVPLSPMYDETWLIDHPYYLKRFCNETLSVESMEALDKALNKPVFKIASRTKKCIMEELKKGA